MRDTNQTNKSAYAVLSVRDLRAMLAFAERDGFSRYEDMALVGQACVNVEMDLNDVNGRPQVVSIRVNGQPLMELWDVFASTAFASYTFRQMVKTGTNNK